MGTLIAFLLLTIHSKDNSFDALFLLEVVVGMVCSNGRVFLELRMIQFDRLEDGNDLPVLLSCSNVNANKNFSV